MNSQARFISKKLPILLPWLLFVIAGSLWLFAYPKGIAILRFNELHTDFTIHLFLLFTTFGEVVGVILVVIYLVFNHSLKSIIGFAILLLLTLSFVSLFKNIVFPDSVRPFIYFREHGIVMPHPPTYYLNKRFSFPSGHTAGSFAYFTYAALWASKNWVKLGLMSFAILCGISRVFLAQHFVGDVLAGSVLGMGIALLTFYIINNKKWMTKPIFTSKIRKLKGE